MQVFIVAALVAVAVATPLQGTGSSATYSATDNAGNYNFGYNEAHTTGGTFRRESGSNGVKIGSYGLTDADGRQRIVTYRADANGFVADIQTNEPGVDASKDPASTSINGSPLVYAGAAPVASYAAVPSVPGVPAVGVPIGYNTIIQHGPVSYAYGYRV